MGLEFLARIRNTSLWVGGVLALVAATYRGPWTGLALALGAVWSLVNLGLLERVVVAITDRDRGTAPAAWRAARALGMTLLLFGAGGILLVLLSPMALLAGFLVPLAVLVAKAAALIILDSKAWRVVTASPWRAALVVATLLVVAWWVVPSLMRSERASASTATAQQHGAPGAHAPAESTAHGTSTGAGHDVAAHGGDAAQGAATEHGAGGHAESQGPQKFANVITVIARAFPNAGWAHVLHEWEILIFSLLIAALICLVAFLATRNPQMIPGPLQNVVEHLVSSLNDFITGILGEKHAARFVPFLGTLFIYIWFMNLAGLIPFMESPTSSLNVTVSLALVVFLYSQYVGLRALGPVGFVDHLMGNPRNLTSWLLVPLMLPIHILGELAKPISLACRLFGNIFGEDMLLVAFVSLGITTLSFANLPLGLPLQLPFMFLALLTSTLQALVFTVLSTIYLLLMLPHDDHSHAHEGEAQHAH